MSALCPVSLPCQARSHPGPAQAQCTRCSRQRHLHLAVLGPAQPVVRPGSGGLSQSPSRALLAAGARTGSAGRVHRPGERLGRGAARGPKGGGGERPSLGQGRGGRGCAAAPGSPRPGNPDRVPGEARAPPPSGSAGRGRAGQGRSEPAAPARPQRGGRGPGAVKWRRVRPVPSRRGSALTFTRVTLASRRSCCTTFFMAATLEEPDMAGLAAGSARHSRHSQHNFPARPQLPDRGACAARPGGAAPCARAGHARGHGRTLPALGEARPLSHRGAQSRR